MEAEAGQRHTWKRGTQFRERGSGRLRNLVELEFGDLGGDEREENEERCEVLHGGGRGKARAGRVQPSKPRWTPEALPRIDQKMNGRFGATEAG